MKSILSIILVFFMLSVLYSNANDCAISCFNTYLQCLDQIHPGGRCRAEERQCFVDNCNFDNATKECISKCDEAFQDCPVTMGYKCVIAERQCYTDC